MQFSNWNLFFNEVRTPFIHCVIIIKHFLSCLVRIQICYHFNCYPGDRTIHGWHWRRQWRYDTDRWNAKACHLMDSWMVFLTEKPKVCSVWWIDRWCQHCRNMQCSCFNVARFVSYFSNYTVNTNFVISCYIKSFPIDIVNIKCAHSSREANLSGILQVNHSRH